MVVQDGVLHINIVILQHVGLSIRNNKIDRWSEARLLNHRNEAWIMRGHEPVFVALGPDHDLSIQIDDVNHRNSIRAGHSCHGGKNFVSSGLKTRGEDCTSDWCKAQSG